MSATEVCKCLGQVISKIEYLHIGRRNFKHTICLLFFFFFNISLPPPPPPQFKWDHSLRTFAVFLTKGMCILSENLNPMRKRALFKKSSKALFFLSCFCFILRHRVYSGVPWGCAQHSSTATTKTAREKPLFACYSYYQLLLFSFHISLTAFLVCSLVLCFFFTV